MSSFDKDRFVELITNEDVISQSCQIFDALKDPTRFLIMSHLALGEKSVSELVEEVGVSQSAMSHQLRLLRDRSLVKSVRKGRNILYSLDDEHVVNLLRVGLEHASERFDERG